MNVVSVTVTEAGRRQASRLPWPTAHGALGDTVRDRWASVDAFVLFTATGVAVRVVGPLLADKRHDPAVVCVDESGRWAVAVCGGHAGGANDLAREVAALLGAEAVVTTASDTAGLPALDTLPGLVASGDVASITRVLLDGGTVTLVNPHAWPLPPELGRRLQSQEGPAGGGLGGALIEITDLVRPSAAIERASTAVTLCPASLVIGVGASSGAPVVELAQLVSAALAGGGLAPASVCAVATIDRKLDEPAIRAVADTYGVALIGIEAGILAGVSVPNPSAVVEAAVGTPSVAEAAALAAAGPGAALVVDKQRSASATVAVARRTGPPGHLSVVGLGPGGAAHRTPAATAAVRRAEVVIGYGPYVDLARDAITPGTVVVRSPIGDEAGRTARALGEAAAGRQVALVCSGDAGVYALASLVFELGDRQPGLDLARDVEVVPGVTAAVAAAALLGAPLGHDHVAISLSDLLTPWEVIEERLRAAAQADLVVSLYNPRSVERHWQLGVALGLLGEHRRATTPVGIVTDAGRPTERVTVTTLADLDVTLVGMTTCVIVGASSTRALGSRMLTPRGYTT